MANDYKAILQQAIDEFSGLMKIRETVDFKLAQKEQFIRATLYQLPDSDRALFEGWADKWTNNAVGLAASIRATLSTSPRKWFTATEVRDALLKAGFDFENYASNPLASIHSSLKRLKPEEAEMTTMDGVMAWRWKQTKSVDRHHHRRVRRNRFLGRAGKPWLVEPGALATILGSEWTVQETVPNFVNFTEKKK